MLTLLLCCRCSREPNVRTIPNDAIALNYNPAELVSCKRPFIAVVVPTTSRSTSWADLRECSLLKELVPSILHSLDTAWEHDSGYDVVLYIGYDPGDLLWDTKEGPKTFLKILREMVSKCHVVCLRIQATSLSCGMHRACAET